jgi:hypothetical protein
MMRLVRAGFIMIAGCLVATTGLAFPAAITDAAAAPATALAFVNQPVNSRVNQPMLNTDGTPAHVRVAAEVTPGGAVDPTYSGTVTLAFANNPGNAQFVVNGSPSTTMTAQASQGIADFSPIIINAVGFGDTLTATASGLAAAVSTPFDVNAAQTICGPGKVCSVTTTSADGLQTATVTEGAGPGILTASFGGNVAPIHPCTTTAPGILTFGGTQRKTITLTITTSTPILAFCYGQPTPFIDQSGHLTTFFNPVNQDFEGLLPTCLPSRDGPCIKQITTGTTAETVVILSGAADPHISH